MNYLYPYPRTIVNGLQLQTNLNKLCRSLGSEVTPDISFAKSIPNDDALDAHRVLAADIATWYYVMALLHKAGKKITSNASSHLKTYAGDCHTHRYSYDYFATRPELTHDTIDYNSVLMLSLPHEGKINDLFKYESSIMLLPARDIYFEDARIERSTITNLQLRKHLWVRLGSCNLVIDRSLLPILQSMTYVPSITAPFSLNLRGKGGLFRFWIDANEACDYVHGMLAQLGLPNVVLTHPIAERYRVLPLVYADGYCIQQWAACDADYIPDFRNKADPGDLAMRLMRKFQMPLVFVVGTSDGIRIYTASLGDTSKHQYALGIMTSIDRDSQHAVLLSRIPAATDKYVEHINRDNMFVEAYNDMLRDVLVEPQVSPDFIVANGSMPFAPIGNKYIATHPAEAMGVIDIAFIRGLEINANCSAGAYYNAMHVKLPDLPQYEVESYARIARHMQMHGQLGVTIELNGYRFLPSQETYLLRPRGSKSVKSFAGLLIQPKHIRCRGNGSCCCGRYYMKLNIGMIKNLNTTSSLQKEDFLFRADAPIVNSVLSQLEQFSKNPNLSLQQKENVAMMRRIVSLDSSPALFSKLVKSRALLVKVMSNPFPAQISHNTFKKLCHGVFFALFYTSAKVPQISDEQLKRTVLNLLNISVEQKVLQTEPAVSKPSQDSKLTNSVPKSSSNKNSYQFQGKLKTHANNAAQSSPSQSRKSRVSLPASLGSRKRTTKSSGPQNKNQIGTLHNGSIPAKDGFVAQTSPLLMDQQTQNSERLLCEKFAAIAAVSNLISRLIDSSQRTGVLSQTEECTLESAQRLLWQLSSLSASNSPSVTSTEKSSRLSTPEMITSPSSGIEEQQNDLRRLCPPSGILFESKDSPMTRPRSNSFPGTGSQTPIPAALTGEQLPRKEILIPAPQTPEVPDGNGVEEAVNNHVNVVNPQVPLIPVDIAPAVSHDEPHGVVQDPQENQISANEEHTALPQEVSDRETQNASNESVEPIENITDAALKLKEKQDRLRVLQKSLFTQECTETSPESLAN